MEACPSDAGLRPMAPLLIDGSRVVVPFQPWRRSDAGSTLVISPVGVVELSPRTGEVQVVRPLAKSDWWRQAYPRGPQDLGIKVRPSDDVRIAQETLNRLQHLAWATFLGLSSAASRTELRSFADAWWKCLPVCEAEAHRTLASTSNDWVRSLEEVPT